MTDPPPADPLLAHPNRDGSVHKGLGLVIEGLKTEDGSRETKDRRQKTEWEKV